MVTVHRHLVRRAFIYNGISLSGNMRKVNVFIHSGHSQKSGLRFLKLTTKFAVITIEKFVKFMVKYILQNYINVWGVRDDGA